DRSGSPHNPDRHHEGVLMPTAPYHFVKTINIADGAQKLSATDIFGRKVILTGYPLTLNSNVFIGYDNTVGPTNFAFALRGGDIHIDESAGTNDRRNPAIFWIAVEADASGLAVGVE